MFDKFMNNYFYGKSGKGDFKKENLPKNRKQLFFAMLKVRFASMFKINFMAVIFFLPLFYVLMRLFGNIVSLMQMILDVQKGGANITSEMQAVFDNRQEALYALIFRASLLMIPALAITGPAQAGLAYITRNWARDEHSFVFSDFKQAIRENWRQALVVSGITSLIPFVSIVCWRFYGALAKDNVLFVVPQMLSLMLALVWLLSLCFMYPMIVSYKSKLSNIIKNSMRLAIGTLPKTVLIRLAALIPSLIAGLVAYFTVNGVYAFIALCGYYLFLGLALSRFLFASYSNALFDKYINSAMEGIEINRGLVKADEETDDIENDDEADEK